MITSKTLPVVAEIQLVYKPNTDIQNAPKVSSSRCAYQIFKEVWAEDTIEFYESFKIILLNSGNKVLGVVEISRGGISGTVVDPKLVFAAALKANSASIILAHNHPSGNLRPSAQDEKLTRRLVEVGKLLDLPILDHIIVTSEGYYSFADEGNL
ncbi:JAB domain-containing protein [Algoriphagus confluentis]|uniref:JAB domain-containing protein n=1 Tax=Algoriphagus confluentis TaxID=1697556 RepID=A0ABQ6PJC5_9BACT|nr:JAB domain-containing protein [Algoriphagus confluentis]